MKHPDPDWKWRGTPQYSQGNYFNPKTGGSLRPDLDHPKPIGLHWDYTPKRDRPNYRWYLRT